MNDELTKNVTGWLYNLLSSNAVTVSADQAEYVVQCKGWLEDVNKGLLIVSPAPSVQEEDLTP